MSADTKLNPCASQTVGPYFRIGLQSLIDESPAHDGETITISGRVLDRDSAPVPDAMLEFWSADRAGTSHPSGFAEGFRRAATDIDGNFSVSMRRPRPIDVGDGRMQAPHALLLFFARGLLRHLISRIYFEDEAAANGSDPVLLGIPPARRHTLVARRGAADTYHWDVILQGDEETVFFAW